MPWRTQNRRELRTKMNIISVAKVGFFHHIFYSRVHSWFHANSMFIYILLRFVRICDQLSYALWVFLQNGNDIDLYGIKRQPPYIYIYLWLTRSQWLMLCHKWTQFDQSSMTEQFDWCARKGLDACHHGNGSSKWRSQRAEFIGVVEHRANNFQNGGQL